MERTQRERQAAAAVSEQEDLQRWMDQKIRELETEHAKQLAFVQSENDYLRAQIAKMEAELVKSRAAATAATVSLVREPLRGCFSEWSGADG